ncbi:MAG: 16S rRNA (uracil(1498)-N(3))-methyltransferase [Planctomycetes bacterium]|nr:16S rRNA (uracil(1498)-N(3))-methyltransferase [Planctomycetota bacterium]
MHRFYLPALGTENHVWLDGEEAHHAVRVLRLAVGDEVALFDGSGAECLGTVERIERHRPKIVIHHREQADRDPGLAVTLACAVVKAKAMEALVESCAELGLRELVPVETVRSVPKLERKEEAHVARWQRIAIEASKQCRRTTVTRVAAPRPLAALLDKARQWDLRLVFSPHDDAFPLARVLRAHVGPRSAVYLIGPEGGFEETELRDAVGAGFEPVRLGKSTLRTETAAAAALAAILFHYEQAANPQL